MTKVKNNKITPGKSFKSILFTYEYQSKLLFKGHLKAMLDETSWDCIML